MSKKGCSPDNSAMEGFFGRLKVEFFYGRDWWGWSIHGFMDALDEYIHWYNEKRIKLSLGGMSLCVTEDHWGSQHRLWDGKMSASPSVDAYLTTHTQRQATLYAQGTHVAPCGVPIDRYREPPSRKRLRQAWTKLRHRLRSPIFYAYARQSFEERNGKHRQHNTETQQNLPTSALV